MSENNSPSDAENQEQAPPSNPMVEPHSGEKEPEKTLTDTEPPPKPSHGWLDQFDAFKAEAFEELEKVAGGGLEKFEAEVLTALAIKLVTLADNHHPGLALEVAQELCRL